jgi:hypothetical protein
VPVAAPRSRKQVTTLQRAAGNAAVRTLLQRIEPSVQRQPAPPGASDAQFQKAVASSDWTGAAIAVNGVNDADFLRLLRGQPPASASRIYTAALRTMTGSARDRFTSLVHQVGNQIAYDGAVAAPDWLWVGLHLHGFLDADIATRVAIAQAWPPDFFRRKPRPWIVRQRRGCHRTIARVGTLGGRGRSREGR